MVSSKHSTSLIDSDVPQNGRKPWTKPVVKRMIAGSAQQTPGAQSDFNEFGFS